MNLKTYADQCAQIMHTEVDEVYEEELESDAGFSLKNGYSLQIAPYMPKPHNLSFFDGAVMTEKLSETSMNKMLEAVKKYVEKKAQEATA